MFFNLEESSSNNAVKITELMKLNPWRYSSEEPRPTEAVAARWQFRGLVASKALSLNLNFSFVNRISLLLISSSYPIVLTRLGGSRSRSYTSRKISRVQPGIEPGTSWMAVRRANHYTRKAVLLLVIIRPMYFLCTSIHFVRVIINLFFFTF